LANLAKLGNIDKVPYSRITGTTCIVVFLFSCLWPTKPEVISSNWIRHFVVCTKI